MGYKYYPSRDFNRATDELWGLWMSDAALIRRILLPEQPRLAPGVIGSELGASVTTRLTRFQFGS